MMLFQAIKQMIALVMAKYHMLRKRGYKDLK